MIIYDTMSCFWNFYCTALLCVISFCGIRIAVCLRLSIATPVLKTRVHGTQEKNKINQKNKSEDMKDQGQETGLPRDSFHDRTRTIPSLSRKRWPEPRPENGLGATNTVTCPCSPNAPCTSGFSYRLSAQCLVDVLHGGSGSNQVSQLACPPTWSLFVIVCGVSTGTIKEIFRTATA